MKMQEHFESIVCTALERGVRDAAQSFQKVRLLFL
jgi:hypothetical protein